jgi:hypothetical protein
VEKLVPAIQDDTEFLKLFKQGIGAEMFNEYQPNQTMNSGANVLK